VAVVQDMAAMLISTSPYPVPPPHNGVAITLEDAKAALPPSSAATWK
jgi:hypothetical protein